MSVLPHPLSDVVRERAQRTPEQIGYRFWRSSDEPIEEVTYGELLHRVEVVARHLRDANLAGQRLAIMHDDICELLVATLASMSIGATAVPLPPPTRPRHLPRVTAVLDDCDAAAVLCTRRILGHFLDGGVRHTQYGSLAWLATDDLDGPSLPGQPRPSAPESRVALLQYTSGSTSEPRGVRITHDNLIDNARAICERFRHGTHSRGVIWLPPYHDMGLMGGLFQPLYVGFPVVLLPALSFVQRPSLWLRLISDWKATTSGGPCFGYELCVKNLRDEQLEGLDLSSWSLAFVGAEPVRPPVLQRFADRFARCGFSADAFYPCYGLAEGTLMSTGPAEVSDHRMLDVDRDALERGRAEPAGDGASVSCVSVGRAIPGHTVAIVDPERCVAVADGVVGEIWLRGPSVADGYWKHAPAHDVFDAPLDRDGVRTTGWLRTGDLGFLDHGLLYVTGRRKNVIILNGRNLTAEDIELVAETADPRIVAVAALALEIDGQERIALVAEVSDGEGSLQGVADALRSSVAHGLQAPVSWVGLTKPRRLPRTTSGKLRRQTIRQLLRDGGLEVTASFDHAGVPKPLEAVLT